MFMNLFALLKDNKNNNFDIVKISLSRDVQNDLKNSINTLVKEILEKKEIPFNGQYKPDDDEVLKIEGFKISFKDKLTIDCGILSTEDEIDKIKSLIFYFNENKIAFQTFDSRKIIQPDKWNLFLSNQTFSKLNKKGISIDKKIDVLFKEGNLLFYSYHNASKIFSNLSNYYREITEKELDEILKSNNIEFEQEFSYEILNSRMRKKLFLIKKNNIFEEVKKNYEIVKNYASKFELVSYFEKDKIIFPKDKGKLKKLIDFLNEDLFESPISKALFETNSKRKVIINVKDVNKSMKKL